MIRYNGGNSFGHIGAMMSDPRVQKLADLLVNFSVAVQPGDKVLLRSNLGAMPLLTASYRAVIQAGGHPVVAYFDDSLTEILLKEGNDAQIDFVDDARQLILETFDCLIGIRGATNTRALTGVDPSRQQRLSAAGRGIQETIMRRTAVGEFRWVATLFPTEAYAQDADMSLAEYEAFVYGACHVDKADPVAVWRERAQWQQKLVDWLAGKQQMKVQGTNVDLTLSINGRTFVNDHGRANMPGGEIFTGPVEQSVNGWVRFSYPAIHEGREVEGIELCFEEGKVVQASARKNEPFLLSVLDTDPWARYLGEFAIGTNEGIDRFTRSILFDEKIGGTIHMALGAGYPQTGSLNQSAVHWDMICDMRDGGQIWVDGELFYENGRFLILD